MTRFSFFPAHIVKVSKDTAVAHFEEEARTNRSSAPSIMAFLVRDAASNE
jgi:hypothetical protein